MHELSVAQHLVELVSESLANEGDVRVSAVHLKLGPLSGVVPQALVFSFDAAAAGTLLDGARLEIEEVEPAVYCPGCGMERPLLSVQRLSCKVCGAVTPHVVRGRELEVTQVEVVDVPAAAAAAAAGPGAAVDTSVAGAVAADRAGAATGAEEE